MHFLRVWPLPKVSCLNDWPPCQLTDATKSEEDDNENILSVQLNSKKRLQSKQREQ